MNRALALLLLVAVLLSGCGGKTQLTDVRNNQIKTIVERIGKEKNYGVIIDSAALAVLYINADYDLTNDVLAALARGDD